jgi:hypothetical protein
MKRAWSAGGRQQFWNFTLQTVKIGSLFSERDLVDKDKIALPYFQTSPCLSWKEIVFLQFSTSKAYTKREQIKYSGSRFET